MIKKKTSAFIVPLALSAVALVAVVITTITSATAMYRAYMRTAVMREQAHQLALSGIHIAMSQLAYPSVAGAESKNDKQQKQDPALALLQQIVPTINRVQTFKLQDKIDGITGEIDVCITCEQGKINLNALYDFEKHEFAGNKDQQASTKKMLQDLCAGIEKKLQAKNIFTALEKFLKERKYPLNDATELVTIPEFKLFKDKLFYEPLRSEKASKAERSLYLTDIFTSWGQVGNVDPWVLSDSLCALLDLKRAAYNDSDQRERNMREKIKEIKVKSSWSQDWNKLLASWYGKNIDKISKEIVAKFNDTFGPEQFFVISYGTVRGVTDRVGAVLELKGMMQSEQSSLPVTLKKLYWL